MLSALLYVRIGDFLIRSLITDEQFHRDCLLDIVVHKFVIFSLFSTVWFLEKQLKIPQAHTPYPLMLQSIVQYDDYNAVRGLFH